MKLKVNPMSEKYLCWSCSAEFTKEEWQKENPKKTGEPRGLCKWCKDLNRSFFGGINE